MAITKKNLAQQAKGEAVVVQFYPWLKFYSSFVLG